MKLRVLTIMFVLGTCFGINAQNKREKLTVISIDTQQLPFERASITNMVRVEIEQLNLFDVTDRYEVQQFLEDNKIALDKCYSKSCLLEVGKMMGSDKMFSGSIEEIGKNITISYRVTDVASGQIQTIYVHEFLNITEEIQNMVKLSVADCFKIPYDENLMKKLSKINQLENAITEPNTPMMRLDGPRMGFVGYTGQLADRITDSKANGGFDCYPVMFQFGYQFEKRYLNEGNVQALFEFIPMITGLDQARFIPSFAVLNGIRSNINGWEFAFGPTFTITRMAKGYYDKGVWHLQHEWDNNLYGSNPYEIVERVDSRGLPALRSSLVIAAGRTFRSGRLNIPLNAFIIPSKSGWRIGVSFGFNAKNTR